METNFRDLKTLMNHEFEQVLNVYVYRAYYCVRRLCRLTIVLKRIFLRVTAGVLARKVKGSNYTAAIS